MVCKVLYIEDRIKKKTSWTLLYLVLY